LAPLPTVVAANHNARTENEMKYLAHLTLSFLTLLMMASACQQARTPVVVHVFRDHDGTIGKNIDRAIRTIGLQQLTTSDGNPIVVATIEFKDYQEGLATIGMKHQPDIVIFNSRADLPATNLGGEPTKLDCAPGVTCVAVIPSWTTGKNREASERVLDMISSNLPSS
jgi:hypothetical protein